MWGADVDQLDALARDLRAAADRLESLGKSLGGRIDSVPWNGRDATTFRHDWRGRHASVLRTVEEAMQEAARAVTANAAEQRRASEASGGGSRGSSGWTAGRVFHDLREGAGVVGDVAGQVQVAADATALVAGGVALAGVPIPGVGWADTAVMGSVAVTAADVAEVSGMVNMAGDWIRDPDDPKLGEQVNVEMATSGLAGADGLDDLDGLYRGAQGLTGTVMDKVAGD